MTTLADLNDPNDHIRQYLRYYLGLQQAPQYGLLLEAPWGSGKTFQAKKIVTEIVGSEDFVLVSLNGLASQKDIDDALVAAMYPWSTTRGARVGAAVGKALLKHAKIDLPKIESSDLVSRASKSVFIFDDLERCRLPIRESLGYINQFVERDGCKVIILANEKQVEDLESYRLGKEKLIGKTLHVNDDFEGAFEHFINTVPDERCRTTLNEFKEQIRLIYDQSELQNLRILQQTMWDYGRVYEVLEGKHQAQKDAMRHLLQVFFALSLELKAGRINNEDLLNRMDKAMIGFLGNDDRPRPFADANSRYPGIMLYDSILSDDLFYQILALGMINKDAIRSALNASSWFVAKDEPSWRTVWHAAERDDAEVRAAIDIMTTEFEERRYESPGEVLHLFGQMLWLALIRATEWSTEQTVIECKKYVDDLRARGKLFPINEDAQESLRFGSYGGLGFSQGETDEFKELWRYLNEQRSKAEIAAYPAQAGDLLELMSKDASEFANEIGFGRDAAGTYARVPVLAALDPQRFAESAAALPALAYREVLLGLSNRYDRGGLLNELSAERGWAENVETALFAIAAKSDPVARDRLEKNVRWTLSKQLEQVRATEAMRAGQEPNANQDGDSNGAA